MSYARFGENGSDVYVFPSVDGFECCACQFASGRGNNFVVTSRREMVGHLLTHKFTGDVVPTRAIDRLEDEIREVGDRP